MNYCKHLAQCVECESRKTNPAQRLCTCTEQTRKAKMMIEDKTKAPIFDPGWGKSGKVTEVDTSKIEDWDRLVSDLNLKPTQE